MKTGLASCSLLVKQTLLLRRPKSRLGWTCSLQGRSFPQPASGVSEIWARQSPEALILRPNFLLVYVALSTKINTVYLAGAWQL